jgi:hypothetical protein
MHPTTTTETRTRALTRVRRRRPRTRRRDQRGAGAKGVGARRHRDERHRPARAEIDEAALALLARHGAQILATEPTLLGAMMTALMKNPEARFFEISTAAATMDSPLGGHALAHWRSRRSTGRAPSSTLAGRAYAGSNGACRTR